MAVLHAVDGPLEGNAFEVPEKSRVVVGRYEIYDLIVPDPSISRKHFALERRRDGFHLVDLGSLNGTQVNDKRVSTVRLKEGDRILVGQTVLKFDPGVDSAPPPPLPAGAPAAAPPVEEPMSFVEEPFDLDSDVVEPVSEDDIIYEPLRDLVAAEQSAAQTVPMEAAKPPAEAPAAPKKGKYLTKGKEPTRGHRREKGLEATRVAIPAQGATDSPSGRCAICGRRVMSSDIDSGESGKCSLGLVCKRCIEKRGLSARDTKRLEQVVSDRQRGRRR